MNWGKYDCGQKATVREVQGDLVYCYDKEAGIEWDAFHYKQLRKLKPKHKHCSCYKFTMDDIPF